MVSGKGAKVMHGLNNGDVVYFVEDMSVCFGVYDATYNGKAYVDHVELADHRYIDGIPIQHFQSEEKWRKLPKGWTYNTELFKLESRVPEWEQKRRKELKWNRRDDVKTALEEGVLVLSKTIFHGNIEAEVDRHKGFRVVAKYPHWTQDYANRHTDYSRVSLSDVFETYEEAVSKVEVLKAERERQMNMTDEEWSWEEIEKDLKRVDPDYAEECREFFRSLPDIWDVETKLVGGFVYWRYFEKKTGWESIIKEA